MSTTTSAKAAKAARDRATYEARKETPTATATLVRWVKGRDGWRSEMVRGVIKRRTANTITLLTFDGPQVLDRTEWAVCSK